MWQQAIAGAMSSGGGGQSDHTAIGNGGPIHNAGINFGTPAGGFGFAAPGGVGRADMTVPLLLAGAVLVVLLTKKGRK